LNDAPPVEATHIEDSSRSEATARRRRMPPWAQGSVAGVWMLLWIAVASHDARASDGGWRSHSLATTEPSWDLFGFATPPGMASLEKPFPEEYFPFLPDESSERSVSIGTVTSGHIIGAIALPLPGRTYAVLPRQSRRHLSYGSTEMMTAIVEASEAVDEVYPGSILWIGNIGRRGGGDIPWSVSHNAGRDADLAFYTLDPHGRPVAPPDLLRHDDRGYSRAYGGYYRFDVARNWVLVRSLVESRHVQVQFLFISNGLRDQLLAHARAIGERPEIIDAARRVLRQPGAEIPHDDHLHLRVYCSRSDVGGGCVNTGVTHPGVQLYREARAARVTLAANMARTGDPETRVRAIDRLVLLGASDHLDTLRDLLDDPSAPVRRAAVRGLAEIGEPRDIHRIIQRWESEIDDRVRESIILACGQVGTDDAAAFLALALRRERTLVIGGKPYDQRIVAADAAGLALHVLTIDALIATLWDDDVEVRARAADALRHITNQAFDIDWRAADTHTARSVAEQWERWHAANRTTSRAQMLRRGFEGAGYRVTGGARDIAASLAQACGDRRRWISANAQRELMRMTGNTPRSLEWSRQDARTYWTRWVRRNPSRVRN